ncbi:MAG: cell division protein FtsQ/DivIB [Thiohalophilus sp.]
MSVRANQAVLMQGEELLKLRPGRLLLILSVILSGGLLYWGIQSLVNPLNVPVDKIRVQGSFVNVTEAMLNPLSKSLSGVGYFDINVAAVQQQVESLPWIKHATVRRIWPDTLVIHFIEQQPLAVWAAGGLLNRSGDIFKPAESTYPPELPVFQGPEKLRGKMLDAYQRFAGLLAPLEVQIVKLKLDQRQAWQIGLDNGIHLKLGREHEFERLARFVRVYPRLNSLDKGRVTRVDLRYTNGMAVAWEQNRTSKRVRE